MNPINKYNIYQKEKEETWVQATATGLVMIATLGILIALVSIL